MVPVFFTGVTFPVFKLFHFTGTCMVSKNHNAHLCCDYSWGKTNKTWCDKVRMKASNTLLRDKKRVNRTAWFLNKNTSKPTCMIIQKQAQNTWNDKQVVLNVVIFKSIHQVGFNRRWGKRRQSRNYLTTILF